MAETPPLSWLGDIPVSTRFADTYFSQQGGLEESRAVFLAGCGLPGAWAGKPRYYLGETGFGTGLNALALWQCWRQHRPANGRLVMLSIEAYPLAVEDARRAHAAFPGLAPLSAALLAQWPAAAPGPQLLDFPADHFSLIVVHGPADSALKQVQGRFDGWFLDGFAPSKNPDIWTADIFATIAALCAPNARAASFTVAGAVRRNLAAAGFTPEKMPGFGRKTSRLEARLTRPPAPAPRAQPFPRAAPRDGDILIVGGGIAGCAMAHALRARGRSATIISHGPAASTLPAALLTPWLEAGHRPHANALYAAFLYAANLYERLDVFDTRGGQRLLIGAARAAALASLWPGLTADGDRLHIARAGTLDPARALAALAGDTPRITAQVAGLTHDGSQWTLHDHGGGRIAAAPIVILAGGAAGSACALLAPLNLMLSAGQLSLHASPAPPASLIVWGSFIAPVGAQLMVGTTHDATSSATPPEPDAARAAVLTADASRITALAIDPEPQSLWSGVRASSADRLPTVGPLVDAARYQRHFAAQARGGPVAPPADLLLPGLHCLTGFGARGFAHAPLMAQALAADLCGEPSPFEQPASHAFHPARFLWRALKRGEDQRG